jgi:hypothetical protein
MNARQLVASPPLQVVELLKVTEAQLAASQVEQPLQATE